MIDLNLKAVKFPIAVSVLPGKGQYSIEIEYDGMKYSKADMLSFLDIFAAVLQN